MTSGSRSEDGAGELASLYARWRAPLMRMLRRHFGSPAEIEDAAQEVFVRMASAGKVLAREEEQPYLRQTLRSVAAYAWRKGPGVHGLQALSFDDCRDELQSMAAETDGDAGAQAEHRQRLARLHDAMSELPARQREAFTLHRVEGHTVQETADRMGISQRMAVKHLGRALAYCDARVGYASLAQMRQLQAAHLALSHDDESAELP